MNTWFRCDVRNLCILVLCYIVPNTTLQPFTYRHEYQPQHLHLPRHLILCTINLVDHLKMSIIYISSSKQTLLFVGVCKIHLVSCLRRGYVTLYRPAIRLTQMAARVTSWTATRIRDILQGTVVLIT